jgi:hypothetical protein
MVQRVFDTLSSVDFFAVTCPTETHFFYLKFFQIATSHMQNHMENKTKKYESLYKIAYCRNKAPKKGLINKFL